MKYANKNLPWRESFFFLHQTLKKVFEMLTKCIFYFIEWWSEALCFLTSEVEDVKSGNYHLPEGNNTEKCELLNF